MKKIVSKLKEKSKTISTMESCTGGFIASAITDIEGSSDVIGFSAVTYSNDFKMKLGVSKETIDKYSVYSYEVAKEMSKAISSYANSSYGIGITGKLNRIDKKNLYGANNIVYISIYDKDNDKYHTDKIEVFKDSRNENKKIVLDKVVKMLDEIILVK